jgi:hypothetical protein
MMADGTMSAAVEDAVDPDCKMERKRGVGVVGVVARDVANALQSIE